MGMMELHHTMRPWNLSEGDRYALLDPYIEQIDAITSNPGGKEDWLAWSTRDARAYYAVHPDRRPAPIEIPSWMTSRYPGAGAQTRSAAGEAGAPGGGVGF